MKTATADKRPQHDHGQRGPERHAAAGDGYEQQRGQDEPQHGAQERGVEQDDGLADGVGAGRLGEAAQHGGVEQGRQHQQDDGADGRALGGSSVIAWLYSAASSCITLSARVG